MDTQLIRKHFERMGARVEFSRMQRSFQRDPARMSITIDIEPGNRGQQFKVEIGDKPIRALRVVDLRPADRHLLLMVDEGAGKKHKFLCGHDEREWFVAATPPRPGVVTVADAMEALKPPEVRFSQARHALKAKDRKRRKNKAFLRQGEWFFIPRPEMRISEFMVLRSEPLARPLGKPHVVEFVYRTGGETVYVSSAAPNGLPEADYRRWLGRHSRSKVRWQVMRRNPGVFAKGYVRHADHKTIWLPCWHEVRINTESEAPAAANVVFFD